MSIEKLKSYRFATDAQWDACVFVQADRDLQRTSSTIRPIPPYARPGTRYESNGAHAPAITLKDELLWCDDDCVLHRLTGWEDEPETSTAPLAMARASRIAVTSSGLWLCGESPASLTRFEEDTLTRLLTIDLQDARVVDIANGGEGCVLALVEHEGEWQSLRVDLAGHVVEAIEFQGISDAREFVFLRRSERFVVLAGEVHPRLCWFAAEGGAALFSMAVAALRPCFQAQVLGSDSDDRVFLAGADGDDFGGRSYVFILDADGNRLGELPLDLLEGAATGITACRDSLLVTGSSGLWQFHAADLVPEGAGEVQCQLMTPSLFSPDREDQRRWLRIEATADLPDGSTLEISWVATDDDATRDRLIAVTTDDSLPALQRVNRIQNEPDLRSGRTVFHDVPFHGAADSETSREQTFSAKLFDVKERYLWVFLSITAAAGSHLPAIRELNVFYPGRTLMQDLPAIYQKEEHQPDSFLRALVGVLETTTQGLDSRIGSLGSQVHPSTAPEPWLDFVAHWLGVPWDDALTLRQKRSIVTRAAELAKGRGTRAGLEALLECLIPGKPRRFRVTDTTADYGFAVIGSGGCAGSTLPAMLGGRTPWSTELDSSSVLGHMRLPCPGQADDSAWHLAGKIRIDVAATAAERRDWEPWLLALITEVVPFTARVELRWVVPQALRTNRLDGLLKLEAAPSTHLGTDAITGQARLPNRGTGSSAAVPSIGTRLR